MSAAAFLTPLSYVPTLRRVIRYRTADGLSIAAGVVAVTSYGAWLMLARTHTSGMYVALVASTSLAWLQLVLVRRWLSLRPFTLAGAMLLALAAATLAWWSAPLALILLVGLDIGWYLRTIRDIRRSASAAAVSVWEWVLTVTANVAWVAESIRVGNEVLAVQCSLLLTGAAVALWSTVRSHRMAPPVAYHAGVCL